jgi:signal peptidase I
VYSPPRWSWEERLLPFRSIQRADVVVFKQPREPEVDFIKRVIGLPGETIELRDGHLFVDGRRIEEPYLNDVYRREDLNRNYPPTRVPPDHYWVMGDHRNASSDSREWGPVPRRLIKGRALLIWWSYDEPQGTKIYKSFPELLRSWGNKALHFFTRSRWDRCFQLIR